MAWAFLLVNVAVVLLAAGLRYPGAVMRYASPVGMGPGLWWSATGCLAALAVGFALADAKRLRRAGPRQAMMELTLVFVLLFAFEWGMLPAHTSSRRWVDWAVMAALAAAVALFCWRDRGNFSEWGLTRRNFAPAARLLAVPTAIMIAAPVIAAVFVGTDCELSRTLVALAGYPFYAFAQLLVFEVFLVRRLRELTDSRTSVVLVAAGVFALLHWPNGLLMVNCGAAAVVWTWVYLKRPNVYALALSFGLAATAFANALPRDLTQNLRTGPICVQRLIDVEAHRADVPSAHQAD